jgi:hypothetical protein
VTPRATAATRILAAAGVFALAVAGWMGYAAARHNPQGEFSAPDVTLSLVRLLPITGPWFVAAFLLSASVLWIIRGVLREGQS